MTLTKRPDASELVKKADYNKTIEIGAIDLATTCALNAVENKIPKVSDLIKKQMTVQKYQIFRLNISRHLIITTSRVKIQ